MNKCEEKIYLFTADTQPVTHTIYNQHDKPPHLSVCPAV
jgi:hypothetical protein